MYTFARRRQLGKKLAIWWPIGCWTMSTGYCFTCARGAAWGLLRSGGSIFVLPDTRRARSRAWVLVIAFLVYPEDAGQVCVGGSSEGLLIHAAACVQSSSELSPCVQCPIYIYGGVTSDACILEPALSFDIVEEGITVRWLWY